MSNSAPEIDPEAKARERRARQTVINLLLSLAATAGLVLIMVLVTPRPTTSLLQKVDYKAAAADAGKSANLPVIAPELINKTWYSNSARWNTKTADGVNNWYVGFVGPKNQYLGVTQGFGTNPTWVVLQLKGDLPTGATSIGGLRWTVWQSTTKNDPALTRDYALVTDVKAGTRTDQILVYGTASKNEFRKFATLVAERLKVLYP
ncbi:MAG: hypothetical protein RJA35_243 [Actinomycetota bacterium]|jgi:hypothetical protein